MKRSKHSLSKYRLGTCNQGQLVPIGLTEVLPGDTFQHATNLFMRVSPLVTPVMHPVHAKIHHFFVPHRLVWEDWEDFITGGPDGMDDSVFPTISAPSDTGWAVGSLSDHLGVPPSVASLEVSALPYRGYALIFNEYYRDQDLVSPLPISTASGVDTTTSTALQNAGWEKDYFTSARPWEQKGPSINIPISGNAKVTIDKFNRTSGAGAPEDIAVTGAISNSPNTGFAVRSDAFPASNTAYDGTLEGFADMSSLSAVDMNDLRIAMALQRYEEARARYGSRYSEYLAYLGVRSSDARLQRPEYLGGGKQTIQFSEVLATAESEDVNVGDMKGHGIGVVRSNRYRRFFEEHGYVFSFLIVRPIAIYSDGLERTWNRRTKEDFWQMELQHVGQQAILNKEVYAASATPNGHFGFQDRYDEYRRGVNSISGEMRTLLESWNMARMFDQAPVLNGTFVTANPTDRIYASSATDQLIFMARHSIQARRKVAKLGTSYIF